MRHSDCCSPCPVAQDLYPSDGGVQQVLALRNMLEQLHPVPKTFLYTWLEQDRKRQCSHLQTAQLQANDPTFVHGLLNEPRDVAVKHLLQHLPLLQPHVGDCSATHSYLHVLPRIVEAVVEQESHQGLGMWEDVQQLLTYAFLHPAFSSEEKRSLAQWVQQLDERMRQHGCNAERKPSLCAADTYSPYSTAQPGWDAWPYCKQDSLNVNAASRVRRSNSLTPPSEAWHTSDDNSGARFKSRSHSLSSDLSSATPQTPLSVASSSGSGSDCYLNGSGSESLSLRSSPSLSSFQIEGSGMKDVPSWLKSLRLHKYAGLFAQMAYDTMLKLTEEQLESQGVTKGARHKIALSIQRLRERPQLLLKLEKEVSETGNVQNALTELKAMLQSPIKPYNPPQSEPSGFSSFLELDSGLDETSRASLSSEDVSKEPGDLILSGNLMATPTVIVSAAPDSDSGHEGSETSDPEHDEAELARKAVGEGRDREIVPEKEDLPGQITRVLGKVCTQLLVSPMTSEDSLSQFLALLERCLGHEAFALHQKKRLASWKEQAQRLWRTLPVRKAQDSRFNRRWSNVAHYPGFYSESGSSNPVHSGNVRTSIPSKYGRNTTGFNNTTNESPLGQPKNRPLAATQSYPLSNNLPELYPSSLQHRNSFCISTLGTLNAAGVNQGLGLTSLGAGRDDLLYRHRTSLEDSVPESSYSRMALQRARSAPMSCESSALQPQNNTSSTLFGPFPVSRVDKDFSVDSDINHRLESLCLSMTEHALGGANDS